MEDPQRDATLTPATSAGPDVVPPSPAEDRFQSCRWRSAPGAGSTFHCTHRDVLPFAGTSGFSADAWCLECTYYKPRRITRKREDVFDR